MSSSKSGHLENIGADGGSDSLSSVQILSGYDCQIRNNRFRIERQFGQSRIVLCHELLLLLIRSFPDHFLLCFPLPLAAGPQPRGQRLAANPRRGKWAVSAGDAAVPLHQSRSLQTRLSGAVYRGSAGALHLHGPCGEIPEPSPLFSREISGAISGISDGY